MNGNASIRPSRSDSICRITAARFVRRISGGVYGSRLLKSASEYSRMQSPGPTRPHRPARWLAEACETGSIGSRCTLLRAAYRLMRARPGSITTRMPGTVSDDSATLVASTTRRPRAFSNTFDWASTESRPYSGSSSVRPASINDCSRPRSCRVASRMSRSVGMNTSTSPGCSCIASQVAATVACIQSPSRSGLGLPSPLPSPFPSPLPAASSSTTGW